jgi:ubiquinone/menaquinone biosynthesis C-methylase UbiE
MVSRFFSNIQEAPWYSEFLGAIVRKVGPGARLLDIGTGPGKLLELLYQEKAVQAVGADTSVSMLEEARRKLQYSECKLVQLGNGEPFPFEAGSFEYVTFCSVLFNLEPDQYGFLLAEARRVLTENGQILVLSPSGRAGGYLRITARYFSFFNLSMYLWYTLTRERARHWSQHSPLKDFAGLNQLAYAQEPVFDGFALLEILGK